VVFSASSGRGLDQLYVKSTSWSLGCGSSKLGYGRHLVVRSGRVSQGADFEGAGAAGYEACWVGLYGV